MQRAMTDFRLCVTDEKGFVMCIVPLGRGRGNIHSTGRPTGGFVVDEYGQIVSKVLPESLKFRHNGLLGIGDRLEISDFYIHLNVDSIQAKQE